MNKTDTDLHMVPGGEARLGQVDTSYFLVGVGASAGGLEAIKTFLAPIPGDCPHSFVFIQHISPDYKSLMGDLLRRETSLKIAEVEDNMPIDPGHVYIIPPKANVIIQGTNQEEGEDDQVSPPLADHGLRFTLVDQPPRPQLNLPIDLFFQSLAEAVGDRAVAVILSGTGSDGSRGLRAVKDADGMVMVQDPGTAAFDGMPRAAITTKLVDMVLQPDLMGKELYRYFDLHRSGLVQVERLFQDSEDALETILDAVGQEAQIDFQRYKRPTLQRRIARRMSIKGCTSLESYLQIIEDDPNEVAILHREFLVGVTHFFRDYPAWEILHDTVLPSIVENHSGPGPIKVWSVGCSTGEEAYSIAMMLDTYLTEIGSSKEFKVFATDVNEAAIETAREGIYPENAMEDIPEKYASTYMSYRRGGVVIKESLRRSIIFSTHNAGDDAPFIHTDLLICRNMLIYLTPALQAQLLTSFSYALNHGGYLFLGASESIERGYSRFSAVDVRWRIFRNSARAQIADAGSHSFSNFFAPAYRPLPPMRARTADTGGDESVRTVVGAMMGAMDSCALVVTPNMQILETFGDYQRFIRLPRDGFSAKLLDLVPDRLISALSIVFRKADKEGTARYGPVKLMSEDRLIPVDLTCAKVEGPNTVPSFVVVLSSGPETVLIEGDKDDHSVRTHELSEQARYVAELEAELAAARETLEATVEDLGVSNEELQTSNEELMSANEELQSTNEEMQSVNEELHTINAEHTEKIAELEAAYADIDNLLNSTEIATVFLDPDLRIRRFSETIKTHFNLDARDIGRPLVHFSSHLDGDTNARLLSAAQLALEKGEPSAYEVQSNDGSWYYARIRPFAGIEGGTEGVVLTFTDITQPKIIRRELEIQRGMTEVLEALLEGETAGYWDWNMQENSKYLSPQFKKMFGYEPDEMENTPEAWQALIFEEDLARHQAALDEHIASEGETPYDLEVRFHHKNGSTVWVNSRGRVIEWDNAGKPLRMIGCHLDITQQKEREFASSRRAEEIRRFAYIAAHDLREPMTTIQTMIELLTNEIGDDLPPKQTKIMNFVTTASTRMSNQIDGVLDYAKLLDGDKVFADLDMNKLVKTCLEDLAEPISEAKAKIKCDKLKVCKGSEPLIARVIQNLVSNAVKFRDKKRPLKISITSKDNGRGQIEYSVSDNGIGIPEKHRDRIFELFYRLHTEKDYSGGGLGLAMCARILEIHSSAIWVEDGEDGGSCFKFILEAA